MKRLIGIDYGKKRIGLAQTDPLRLFAQPIGTFSPDEIMAVLQNIILTDGIETFVVGLPLQLDDSEGEAVLKVRAFTQKLSTQFPEIPIIEQDERFSSEMAKDMILASGLKKKARRDKSRVDRTAATIILQDYLNG
jgi:putative Holliday junction resolvase